MFEAADHQIDLTMTAVDVVKFSDYTRARHAGQLRRDGSPYFGHCRNVADLARAAAANFGEHEVGLTVVEVVGLGHDLFEDTRTDYDDVAALAGAEVASLISWLSDDKRLPGALRHRLYMQRLGCAPRRAQIVKLADIYDNSRDALALTADVGQLSFLARWRLRASETLACLGEVVGLSLFYDAVGLLMKLQQSIDAATADNRSVIR